MRRRRHPAVPICIALLGLIGLAPAPAQEATGEPAVGGEESPLSLRVGMFQTVYEAEQVLRGELSVINTGEEWVEVKDAKSLASALKLRTAEGNPLELDQKAAKKFGAADAGKIGPGGFVGVTFDAGQLFPAVHEPGRYEIFLEYAGERSPVAGFQILPAFDPDSDYRLILEAGGGELTIDLFEKQAPRTVRNIVNLARTGFYDGARIPRAQAEVALKIAGPVTPKHRIQPVENAGAAMLAGSVLAEPSGPPGRASSARFSLPNLLVLLGPQPSWQGTAAVVGQLIEGDEALSRLVQQAPRARIDGARITQTKPQP
jgi:hypothetical protein